MAQQLCSHPLPQLSKELTVSSQPLEMHRDYALSGRLHAAACHNTTHKETQQELSCARPVSCSPLHKSHQQPQGSDCCGTAFPELPHSTRLQKPHSQPAVPPAAVTISLLTPQPRWKHRQEQSHLLLPGRAGGASKAMTGTVAVVGTRLPRYQHSRAAVTAA